MRYGARLGLGILATVAGIGVAPGVAAAAPPPNDNRAQAQAVGLPSTTDGTTVEATQEPNEPGSSCASPAGTVWYRVTPGRDGRVILGLAANGDLDAVIDVYSVRRSQVGSVACDVTDENGRASLSFPVAASRTYLIRVAPLFNSVSDTFRLTLQLGEPDAEPPGPPLPRAGGRGTLHRVLNPSDAYSVRLREGVTYRFNLATPQCTQLALYPPGTDSFEGERPAASVGCNGYIVFTPDDDEGGVYSLLASSAARRDEVPYRLMARRAGRDDIAPGRFVRNYQRSRGKLNANTIDVVDLYRFDVERRSDLRLALRSDSGFGLTLLRAGGKVLERGSDTIDRRVSRGRYFAVVRAGRRESGSYVLRRVSRTITRTRIDVNGRKTAKSPPGRAATIGVRVAPGERGPVTIRIERFDPIQGWQFDRTVRVRASSSGAAAVRFNPPSVGRWRMRASFLGTRRASPSRSGYAELRVRAPLQE